MSDAEQLRATAIHEAGHAYAQWFFGMPTVSVTIVPNEERGSLGHVMPGKTLSAGIGYLDLGRASQRGWHCEKQREDAASNVAAAAWGHLLEASQQGRKIDGELLVEGVRLGYAKLAEEDPVAARLWVEHHVIVFLAGDAAIVAVAPDVPAERRLGGGTPDDPTTDLGQAHEFVTQVTGEAWTNLPQTEIDFRLHHRRAWVDWLWHESLDLLRTPEAKNAVRALADVLLAERTISGERAAEVFDTVRRS